MSIITYLEYPVELVPPDQETEQVIRFLVGQSGWIKPKSYGSGEPGQPMPKLAGDKAADFLVDFWRRERRVVLEEKRGLQLIFSPPTPTLKAGTISWEAPSSHPALKQSAHIAAVWHLMHLIHSPVAEAMSKPERDAFTRRLVQKEGYEERVRTVRANRWGLRHAFWRLWFGAPYVSFFGRDKLEQAPAFFKQPLDPDGYFVQVYEDPDEWDSPEAAGASKTFEKALGRKAFYNPESPDDKLETPFD